MSASGAAGGISARRITVTALFMAMNVVLSSFALPVPGGHFYLCDVVICIAGILLGPAAAFAAGGVGSFLGDLLFYPAPMFVSLVSHGLQAVIISVCTRHFAPRRPWAGPVLGVTLGGVVMVVGYTLGRAYIYATPEYAVVKLPWEIAQAAFGAAAGLLLTRHCRLRELYDRFIITPAVK